jgi:KDEL-tailed cysteine endopeptidase
MAITRASLLAILSCLCIFSSVLAARELNDDLSMVARHQDWMTKYGRVYKDAAEKAQRFEIFKTNARFVDSFNAGGRKFSLSINQFADISNDEFRATKTNKGFIPNKVKVATGFRYENISLDALPATVDWRTKGAVTPVKDQGQCGKCICATSELHTYAYFILDSCV